jgi:glycosyltransferase involved in cell wall biosynthesis
MRGGLDVLHDRLAAELRAQVISLPTAEGSLEELVASYRVWAEVDASGFDAVISTKYPAWMAQHPRHTVWMAHKLRGLFDLYPARLPLRAEHLAGEVAEALGVLTHAVQRRAPNREAAALAVAVVEAARRVQPEAAAFPGPLAREVVLRLDELALGSDRIARHAAISRSVARRPGYFPRGAEVRVLHPPLARDALRSGPPGDFLLAVSRLDPPKRLDLVIRAFARVRAPVRLVIAGSGPELERLRVEASGDRRVDLRGFVPDAELADLYAGCLAVVFAPLDEDFGYVCVEAFAAAKPVITTADAGGPAELVEDGVSGRVVLPTERALAEAMEWMAEDPARATRMGQAASAAGERLRWGPALEALLP